MECVRIVTAGVLQIRGSLLLELFLPIKDYPSYAVSCMGRVKNIKTKKVLSQIQHSSGYKLLNIKPCGRGVGKTLRVHRVVCEAFLPNPDCKPQVNHKNGIKSDNRLDNLEWATRSENIRHAFDTGLIVCPKLWESKNSKISKEVAGYCKRVYRPRCKDYGLRALSRKFGVSHSTLSKYLK